MDALRMLVLSVKLLLLVSSNADVIAVDAAMASVTAGDYCNAQRVGWLSVCV